MLDDVDDNMSNKFKKHDLIGVPYQIIVGSKSEGDNLEFNELNSKSEMLSLEKIINKLKKLKNCLQSRKTYFHKKS